MKIKINDYESLEDEDKNITFIDCENQNFVDIDFCKDSIHAIFSFRLDDLTSALSAFVEKRKRGYEHDKNCP